MASLPFQLDYSGDSPNFLRAFGALFGNDSLMKDSTCGLDRTRFGTYFNIFSFWMTRVKIKEKIFWVVVVTRRENEFLSIEEKKNPIENPIEKRKKKAKEIRRERAKAFR